jgi:hypothetical protein
VRGYSRRRRGSTIASTPVTYQFIIQRPVSETHDLVLTDTSRWLAMNWNYKVTADTGTSVTFTRRYTPTWAIVLAIIGLLVFLLGLLFLLVKSEDVLIFSFAAEGAHTKITVTGSGPSRVSVVLAERMPKLAASAAAGWYQQGERLRWWDGTQWTNHYSDAAAPPTEAPEQ